MESLLRARLGSARLLLDGKTGESLDTLSHALSAAVIEIAKRDPGLPEISAEQRASLMELAALAPWKPEHEAAVMNALKEKEKKDGAKTRRPMQHFAPQFMGFFTASEWEGELQTRKLDVARSCIFKRMAALGARNLAEPSAKCMASMLLFLTAPDALQLAPHYKQNFFKDVKVAFKRYVRHLAAPDPYFAVLPSDKDLRQAHPDLWRTIFGDQSTSVIRADINGLISLDQSYTCRGGDMCVPAAAPHGPQEQGGMDAGMAAIFRQMLALQQHTLSMVPSVGRGCLPLRSLSALAAPPSSAVRQLAGPANPLALPVPPAASYGSSSALQLVAPASSFEMQMQLPAPQPATPQAALSAPVTPPIESLSSSLPSPASSQRSSQPVSCPQFRALSDSEGVPSQPAQRGQQSGGVVGGGGELLQLRQPAAAEQLEEIFGVQPSEPASGQQLEAVAYGQQYGGVVGGGGELLQLRQPAAAEQLGEIAGGGGVLLQPERSQPQQKTANELPKRPLQMFEDFLTMERAIRKGRPPANVHSAHGTVAAAAAPAQRTLQQKRKASATDAACASATDAVSNEHGGVAPSGQSPPPPTKRRIRGKQAGGAAQPQTTEPSSQQLALKFAPSQQQPLVEASGPGKRGRAHAAKKRSKSVSADQGVAPPKTRKLARDQIACVHHERSRKQFLVRSGKLGLPSAKFCYNDESDLPKAKSMADAQLAAWSKQIAEEEVTS